MMMRVITFDRFSFVLLLVALQGAIHLANAQLSEDFYSSTSCPNAESIISSTTTRLCQENNVVPIALLRLFAHDCFVDGCDGSILISSSGSERTATDNLDFPQNPFDAIKVIKDTIEASCPGVVSCADLLAIATRDAVVFSGGPSWKVLKGRKDGKVSQASRVDGHLPGANLDISQLLSFFSDLNLSAQDLVALSGGHTIGFSHCNHFTNRLYNFSPSSGSDPSLSSSFVKILKDRCPAPNGAPDTVQAFDISTPFTFDNEYFKHLLIKEGLLIADTALTTSSSTQGFVSQFANDQNAFFAAFTEAMIKLGNIGVKTGSDGEIRTDCFKFNS